MDTTISAQLTEIAAPFILLPVTKRTPASAEKEDFHRRVRVARITSGKTLEQIEEHFGYGKGTHRKHEDGTNEMKRADLVEFCRFMNVDIRWLMAGTAYIKIGLTAAEIDQRIADEDAKDPKRRSRKKQMKDGKS